MASWIPCRALDGTSARTVTERFESLTAEGSGSFAYRDPPAESASVGKAAGLTLASSERMACAASQHDQISLTI